VVWSLREKVVVEARMMDRNVGMERGFGEDVDIYVGIGEFLFQGWGLLTLVRAGG